MFVSWAQNYEDAYLHRCFADRSDGRWIDVGAWLPVVDSVTHHFSERGWWGVNVEPIPRYFDELAAARPRDVNLRLALGRAPGRITLHHVPGTGLSSADTGHAVRGAAARGLAVEAVDVEVTTLDAVWAEHLGGEAVAFVKIDVEGAEADVLAGWDMGRHRAEVLIVESNLPDQQVQAFEHWEPMVVAGGYRFALYDGLNRWYAAEEHPEHLAALAAPLSTFDDVIRSRHLALVHDAEARAASAMAARDEVIAELARTKATLSWRVTAPLRKIQRRRKR